MKSTRNLLRRALVALGLVALIAPASAQPYRHRHGGPPWAEPATVRGKVVDTDGNPVPGATIEVPEQNLVVTSDAQGLFVFRDVAPGAVTVTARAEGFYPSRPKQLVLSPGSSVELEIELVAKAPVVQNIVVTGTQTEHLQTEAPVRTDVVSALDLRERRTPVNLAEALTATVTGVRVETTCQNCRVTTVRLNGLEGKYVQILEDGLPAVSSVALTYALDQIPTEFIESVEIVKGGASALYGPNAVAGVINLIRREPKVTGLSFSSQTGWEYGRPSQVVGLVGQAQKLPGQFSGDFYFRGFRAASIDRDRDGFSDAPRRKSWAGGATLFRWLLEGRGRLVFGGGSLSEFRRGGDHLDWRPHQTWITEMADTGQSNGFVRWQHTLSANTYYRLAASATVLERDTYYGAQFDPNAYGHTENPLWVVDSQLAHQAGPHSLLGGFQFQSERVRDHILAYQRHYDELFRNTGIYFQDEIRSGSRLTVVAGLRADRANTLDHWVISPRANIRLGFGNHWNLRMGLSTGFRAPVIFEEDLHVAAVGGMGFVIVNASDLREERSVSGTASLDYVGAVRARPFSAGVNLFWTRLDDVFVLAEEPVPGSPFRRFVRRNAPGSHVRGIQFDLSAQLHSRLSLRSGMTFQAARYRTPEPEFGSLHQFRSPSWYGFVSTEVSLGGGVSLYVNGDWTGPMYVPHYAGYIPFDRLEHTRSFTVWDARLVRSWTWADGQKVRLFAALENAFDSFQPDLDRGPFRDASYMYGPRQMRTVRFGLEWSWR